MLASSGLVGPSALSPTLIHSALGQLRDTLANSDELRSLLVAAVVLLLREEDDDGRSG